MKEHNFTRLQREEAVTATAFQFKSAPWEIRADIGETYRRFWTRLAQPGCWWTGRERVAIARESRGALECQYCRERKASLSPYQFPGEHRNDGGIPETAIDAVHRIITDQNRVTRTWIENNVTAGLSKEAYVELVGIVVAVFSIDEFHRALGLPLESLPVPEPGEPDRYRPAHLTEEMGFVPTIPPDGAVGPEEDLWGEHTANVIRALSLVPDAVRDWLSLSAAQYLSMEGMANFLKQDDRSINRMQMELVAGRVSAVNECFY